MSLPNKTNLETLDYACEGQPFCNVPAKSGIDLDTMDFAFNAQPFWGNPIEEEFINVIFFGTEF